MKNKIKLSVVLATRNEETNIGRCLESVKSIADEIIIFDEHSSDATVKIAEKLGAKVFDVEHHDNFHITKQKAIEKAKGDWILQMDADEVIKAELSKEIQKVINQPSGELTERIVPFKGLKINVTEKNKRLLARHQMLIEKRDGRIGKHTGEVVAFFIPRVNMFFGKPLIHGGVYPDGVIRLIKRGKARLPAKDVHEQMDIDGEVGWLFNYMEHYDSPSLERYLERNNRYTDLLAEDLMLELNSNIGIYNSVKYIVVKPVAEFIKLYFRHKGILDGFPGFIWSFFSALRFPISYFKYFQVVKSKSEQLESW